MSDVILPPTATAQRRTGPPPAMIDHSERGRNDEIELVTASSVSPDDEVPEGVERIVLFSSGYGEWL